MNIKPNFLTKRGGAPRIAIPTPCSCSPAIAGLGKITYKLLMCKIIY